MEPAGFQQVNTGIMLVSLTFKILCNNTTYRLDVNKEVQITTFLDDHNKVLDYSLYFWLRRSYLPSQRGEKSFISRTAAAVREDLVPTFLPFPHVNHRNFVCLTAPETNELA